MAAALALAARVVVAAAFVVAAVQKLRALPALRAQVEGFGVPGPLVSASVALLPAVELGTAVALVAIPGSPVPAFVAVGASVALLPAAELGTAVALVAIPGSSVPAFVAAGLLGVFTGVVIGNLSRGRHPPCPCFGAAATDAPISARTVVRNGWLLALAVIATGSVEGAEPVPVVALVGVLGIATAWLVATLR